MPRETTALPDYSPDNPLFLHIASAKDTVKICAIILDYRRSDLTVQCVNSLAGQVDGAVVVDNSDDDAASSQLRNGLETHITRLAAPPVTLLIPNRNLGFAAGVNYALHALQNREFYDAFLLVNNDANLRIGAVEQLAQSLIKHGGKALIAPEVTEPGKPTRLWYHTALGIITRHRVLGSFPYLSGTCLLVPRELAVRGLFDEDFFMYGEDVELCWRMYHANVPLVLVPEANLDHLGSASAPPGQFFYEYQTVRAHLLLAEKLASNRVQKMAWLFFRFLSLSARACLRAFRQNSLVPVHAFITALKGRARS